MAPQKETNEGSSWRRWDLQIQPTKSEWLRNVEAERSKLAAATQDYLLAAVAKEIKIVAITDHNSGAAIDEAIRIVTQKQLDVTVLPGVEIDVGSGFQLLIIFDPSYRGKIAKASWNEAVAHFLNNICQISSPVFDSDGCAKSINGDIHEILAKICNDGIGLPIFAHAQSEKGLFKKSTPANRKVFFEHAVSGKYFFAIDHKTDDEVEATRKTLNGWELDADSFALIKTSDAHQASGVGSAFTWIKADRTFEGLKQIIYDPTSRIELTNDQPATPTNQIASFTLSVPTNGKVFVKQADGTEKEEKFCFAGVKSTLELSPYFNCIVGGRGSGKSTILNFLGLRSQDTLSSSQFWTRLRPNFEPGSNDVLRINGVEIFEFIGQSEIESFATNREAFTAAVYERANIVSGGELHPKENTLEKSLRKLIAFRETIESIQQTRTDIQQKEKERTVLEGSIKVAKSKEYVDLANKITLKSNQRQALETWRGNVEDLRSSIESNLVEMELEDDTNEDGKGPEKKSDADTVIAPYVAAIRQAEKLIDEALKSLDGSNFKDQQQLEEGLEKEVDALERQLSQFLKASGLSEENVLQVKSAPQRLVKINDELEKLMKRLGSREEELARYASVFADCVVRRGEFESAITGSIQPLVEVLEEQAKANRQQDIRNIGLRYYFNDLEAWKQVASEVYAYFASRFRSNERAESVRTYIVENRGAFAGTYDDIQALLQKDKKAAGYLKFLTDIFSTDLGFRLFQVMRDSHLNNVGNYKRIIVTYDGKDVESASFGQRCTAVMVILLLFGNYPLIVDEPEAHLDSSLVANYLVPLIKRKKSNRQLIFSTHNANFVVNGDAEKIFILRNDSGTTVIAEATIEDLSHRDDLLKLEGGRDAFRKRGEKLQI